MADDKKKVFSRESVLAKQEEQREEYKKKIDEARRMFEAVAGTPEGEKVLKYIFLLCGGDSPSVRRDKEGEISTDETLLTLGAKTVWETVKFHMRSETVKRIEMHSWEEQTK